MIGKIFKITVNTILTLLVILGIFVIFSFIPSPGNYKVFTVQSGSMEPAIGTGSLIFVKPFDDYKVGNIITKKTKDKKVTVTHRITEVEEKNGEIFYKTKGDANNAEDIEKTPKKDVIGKMIWGLPLIGYPVGYAKTTPGLILIIIIPAVIIIYDEAQKIKKEIEKKLDYRRRTKKKKEDGALEAKNEESEGKTQQEG